jgi:hypothetical protein
MNWEAVGTIAELIGAIGVIVTLVYLAQQIRDNTKQSRLSSIRAINASTDSAFEPIYIPENTRIWTTGLADPGALDEREQHVFDLLMTRLIASFDATTYQYVQGAVPTQLYNGYAAFFSSFVATPGGSAWYARNRALFLAETRRRLDGASASA